MNPWISYIYLNFFSVIGQSMMPDFTIRRVVQTRIAPSTPCFYSISARDSRCTSEFLASWWAAAPYREPISNANKDPIIVRIYLKRSRSNFNLWVHVGISLTFMAWFRHHSGKLYSVSNFSQGWSLQFCEASHTSMHPRISHRHEPNESASPVGRCSRPQPVLPLGNQNVTQNWTNGFN